MTKRATFTEAELARAARVANAERASVRMERGGTVYIVSPVADQPAAVVTSETPDMALQSWLSRNENRIEGSA